MPFNDKQLKFSSVKVAFHPLCELCSFMLPAHSCCQCSVPFLTRFFPILLFQLVHLMPEKHRDAVLDVFEGLFLLSSSSTLVVKVLRHSALPASTYFLALATAATAIFLPATFLLFPRGKRHKWFLEGTEQSDGYDMG